MLSQELRPFDFSEMAGQEENIKILKAVIKNPEQAPKCLIFAGAFGSGKSTSARILARQLNNITDRNYDLLNSQFYYEYDSTVIGNVETIRQLRDQFVISYGDYYRVIVLDETHAVSTAAQNALLKVLEEAVGKVFFVMCTTEPNKLLPTIRSRSLELEFKCVPRDAIIENLTQVSDKRGLNLSEEITGLRADRSEGHMRKAHMLVDKYLLLGEQDFKDSIQSAIKWYCTFFIAVKQGKKEFISASINMLMNIPMEDLHSDWNTIMVESMKAFNGFPVTHSMVKQLVDEYGREHFRFIIMNVYFQPWIRSMFVDMPYFQATMLNLYAILDKYFHPQVTSEQAKLQQQVQEQSNARLRAR